MPTTPKDLIGKEFPQREGEHSRRNFLKTSALTEGHANFSFLDAQYENRNMPVIRPEKEMREQMENIIQMMLKEFDQHGLHRLQVLKGLLQVFMIFLSGKIEVYTQEACTTGIRRW